MTVRADSYRSECEESQVVSTTESLREHCSPY